ncbi:CHC2 zinc finger domain-containing protein [Streptomyces syringium]|uniref:CHC2 zinc finger domain-containing protein n=1 Tax=Streptomyces syringium TaxID=76729 RepID=UPI003D8DEF2F
MKFERIGRRDFEDQGHEKPSLDAVLEHYEVGFNPLRSMGMAPCPFHEDNTPSMSFNTDRGLWRCHSCGRGGDSYTLIMEKENISFVDARALAASLALATGDAGGGYGDLSGSSYAGRRAVPGRSRDRAGRGGYVPAWRR